MTTLTPRNVPFSPPDITDLEKKYVMEALDSGWITTGPKTKTFEKQISAYTGASGTVCMNSATAAMEMTLRMLGIGPGDEVITSAYTYTASASVIEHVGATIVLCDVSADSCLIDVEQLEHLITEKTKAIIPVDIAGVLCDYDTIHRVIENKKHLYQPNTEMQSLMGRITVISDAAHSFGSSDKERLAGSITDFTCFSFHAVKNLTTAEGGAVVWTPKTNISDERIYQELMLWALHGQSKDALSKTKPGAWEYDILKLGYKCNMADIAAAIGIAQLERYDDILSKRAKVAKIYDELLVDKVEVLSHIGDTYRSNFHLYMLRVANIEESQRNAIIIKLAEQGVSANVHFKPLPMLSAYKNLGFDINDFPHAYNQYKNSLTLPIYATLSEEDARYVCQALVAALEEI